MENKALSEFAPLPLVVLLPFCKQFMCYTTIKLQKGVFNIIYAKYTACKHKKNLTILYIQPPDVFLRKYSKSCV